MTLELDPQAGGTLHDRIAATVRNALATGRIRPGERLPAARELADRFDVNTNTVLRAYRILAADGLIDLHRGRGAIVRGEPDVARLHQLVDELVGVAARLGVTRGELIGLIMRRS